MADEELKAQPRICTIAMRRSLASATLNDAASSLGGVISVAGKDGGLPESVIAATTFGGQPVLRGRANRLDTVISHSLKGTGGAPDVEKAKLAARYKTIKKPKTKDLKNHTMESTKPRVCTTGKNAKKRTKRKRAAAGKARSFDSA